jgi:hypothetical protein
VARRLDLAFLELVLSIDFNALLLNKRLSLIVVTSADPG